MIFLYLHKVFPRIIKKEVILVRKMSFCVDNYDCVGFDLDFTLALFKVPELVQLEYDLMSKYLVGQKGYDGNYLLKPVDFEQIQKGLFFDFDRGNVVKMGENGRIIAATHGSKPLSEDTLCMQYGKDRLWDYGKKYADNPLDAWNGDLAQKVRPVLDYFDAPAQLLYSRIVESLDSTANRVVGQYNFWPDILDALYFVFDRRKFQDNGCFFSAIKNNKSKYYYKTNKKIISWLKNLKKTKFTYLVSGSFIDFMDCTASYTLGHDWRELFDVVISYAKKPGFFISNKPFYQLDGTEEILAEEKLISKGIYSQGNWAGLNELMKDSTGQREPRCLYIGDNLIQDVYTPAKFMCCDTVAITAEMDSFNVISSQKWGSFLEGSEKDSSSFWGSLIKKHSKMCIPNLMTLCCENNTASFVEQKCKV